MNKLATAAAALALVSAPFLSAQADELHGHISGTLGGYDNDATDDGAGQYLFLAVDASIGNDFSNGFGWDIDVRLEGYDWESADNTSEQPEATGVIAGHLNMRQHDDLHWGFFGGYGYSQLHEDDNYAMVFGGIEAQSMLDDNIHVFGQLGIGDNTASDGEDEGFQSGAMLRAGGQYFFSDDMSLGLEGTVARSVPYIDGNDDGEFHGVTLSGEMRLLETSLYAGIYASYNHYDATTENDTLDERILGLKLTYRLGGMTSRAAARSGASLGVPLLPIYANGWAEQID